MTRFGSTVAKLNDQLAEKKARAANVELLMVAHEQAIAEARVAWAEAEAEAAKREVAKRQKAQGESLNELGAWYATGHAIYQRLRTKPKRSISTPTN